MKKYKENGDEAMRGEEKGEGRKAEGGRKETSSR